MFKKILVPFDMSEPSEVALDWALTLTKLNSSHLDVIHVIPHTEEMSQHEKIELKADIAATIQNDIHTQVDKINRNKNNTIKPHIKVINGHPTQEILHFIDQTDPDLIILGTHGRTGIDHFLLGSVTEKIIQYSSSPVLVAKATPQWPPKKVLLPYDFSEAADDALLKAVLFCEAFNAKIELLHIITPPEVYSLYSEPSITYDDDYFEKIKAKAQDKIDNIISSKSSVQIHIQIVVGPLVKEICDKANEFHSDLILMPTHGRTGLSHLWTGSVTEQVIRYAKVPVLSFMNHDHQQEKKSFLQKILKGKLI